MTQEQLSVELKLNEQVKKKSGYSYPGTIVAVFQTLAGDTRYVVEATGADYKGMLHIFNGDQLEACQ